MPHKLLSDYGSLSDSHSQLLEISGEVEDEETDDEEVEELEFKKPTRVSAVTVFKYCGATLCLITMVLSCECSRYM